MPGTIVKSSLTSCAPPPFHDTVIRAWVVTGPVTRQLYVPPPAEDESVRHGPPSRLMDTRKSAVAPTLCVHRIVCRDPIAQLSFGPGDVTVTDGAISVNVWSLRSPSPGTPAGLTRTRPWVVPVDGRSPRSDPDVAVAAATLWRHALHVAPPSAL